MIVYLNGQFLPDEHACVSIHDRGFLYGDGLFETIRIYDGEPFLWNEHMQRLHAGCAALKISPPLADAQMKDVLAQLIARNQTHNCIARLSLSRGAGARGYSPRRANHPTIVIAIFPPPAPPPTYKVITSSLRLYSADPLTSFKHANKLHQVLARAEADELGADEALLLNERDEVIEGTSTNLFWIQGDTLHTPPLHGVLPGTTRNYILQRAAALGLRTGETTVTLPELLKANGAFLTSSGIELVEISQINRSPITSSPLFQNLKRAYRTTQ